MGSATIEDLASRARGGDLSTGLAGHLTGFALPVAARRALDYAQFFESREPALAEQKREQAVLFGRSHTLLVRRDWHGVADTLARLAATEDRFRALIGSAANAA